MAGPMDLTDLVVRIAETPSPTHAEQRRADLIDGLWREAGLATRRDRAGNVIAELPGGLGPRVLLAAHLDSVFASEVDVTVRRSERRFDGPGVGDNAASLAVLTRFAQDPSAAPRRPRLTLVATVGEEGLGDLKGARQVVADLGPAIDHFIALDGQLGVVTNQAVGSNRFEARFSGPGGHAWGDYPSPSATLAAATAAAALGRLRVPATPRSSLNIGKLWGGTSINAIAEAAGFNLDLRSVEPDTLAAMSAEALDRINEAAGQLGCAVELVNVGRRPAATVDNGRLVAAATEALAAVGEGLTTSAGSTDANAAMAAGISSMAFGLYRGGNAHRLDEWIDPTSLATGLAALTALITELGQ